MQLIGQVVAKDLEQDSEVGDVLSGVVGIVKETGSATLNQPDRVARDSSTGVEVSREQRPDLAVQTITVSWEDGSESTLTECIDTWAVLGSVVTLPTINDPANPPTGAYAETADIRAQVDAVLVDVAGYAKQLRAAAPLAEARRDAERVVVVEDDGALTVAE